jgi:hypothetical protein
LLIDETLSSQLQKKSITKIRAVITVIFFIVISLKAAGEIPYYFNITNNAYLLQKFSPPIPVAKENPPQYNTITLFKFRLSSVLLKEV